MDIKIYIYKESLLIEDVTDTIELIARRVFTNSKFEVTGGDMWIHENLTFELLHDFIDEITSGYGDEMRVIIA